MGFEAAVVREQGVEFAVVAVKPHVIESASTRSEAAIAFQSKFPGCPIVLMSQDSHGTPKYWGRPDIVRFLADIAFERLPWRRFT